MLVSPTGLAGDEQADLAVHGGAEKAVYGYAARHYRVWRAGLSKLADLSVAGDMGEDLTITGLGENDIFVGDVHRVGSALMFA